MPTQLRRAEREVSRLLAVGAALSLGMAATAGERTGPEELEVLVTGLSEVDPITSACSVTQLSFAGKLLAKAPGHKRRPIRNAQYVAVDAWGGESQGPIPTLQDGSFELTLTAWDHGDGPGPSQVTISAPGCRERQVKVGQRWRPKRIVLSCPSE